MWEFINKNKETIRISMRDVHFVNEDGIPVVSFGYTIQGKERTLVDQAGKQNQRIPIFKKATESVSVFTDPLLEDMLYAIKVAAESYIADVVGLPRETDARFDFDNNVFIKRLKELYEKKSDDKQLELDLYPKEEEKKNNE